MKTKVHETPGAAWAHFRDKCGVEPTGRDNDFVEQLQTKLDRHATDLDTALLNVTNDQLVRAIFECVAPFASMSRDILAFFSNAGASRGQGQWALVVDEVPFDLQDFADFIREMRTSWGVFEQVVLDSEGAFALIHLMPYSVFGSDRLAPQSRDIVSWTESFRHSDRYDPWPASLDPVVIASELRDAAEIGKAVLDEIRSQGLAPSSFGWGNPDPVSILDGASLAGGDLVTAERDHWLRNLIEGLAAAKSLPPVELTALGANLAEFHANLPRRLVSGMVSIDNLTQILSLPVWKRRHEVYAVWIATRIVDALPSDGLEIHHDNGEIRFAFKKAKVASVKQPDGNIVLYAERKEPLAKPIGCHRKRHVQPDFSLWKEGADGDECALVVEVKHYAKAATRSFSEALVDYARAHIDAEVVLVNYGPAADMVSSLDDPSAPVGDRCHHIGDLTPLAPDARQKLAAFVDDAVKALARSGPELIIDVSGSMHNLLKASAFRDWLEGSDNDHVSRVRLVDYACRWVGPRAEAVGRISAQSDWTAEDLPRVARELLEDRAELCIVTDDGGLKGLQYAQDLDVTFEYGGPSSQCILARVRLRTP